MRCGDAQIQERPRIVRFKCERLQISISRRTRLMQPQMRKSQCAPRDGLVLQRLHLGLEQGHGAAEILILQRSRRRGQRLVRACR